MGETFRYFILAAPAPSVVSVTGDGATTTTIGDNTLCDAPTL